MGFVTDEEAAPWMDWMQSLAGQNRVIHENGRWFAVDADRDPKKVLLGRLEALGPVFEESSPSPGIPGEGWGEGSFAGSRGSPSRQSPHPTLSQSTGRGEDAQRTQSLLLELEH